MIEFVASIIILGCIALVTGYAVPSIAGYAGLSWFGCLLLGIFITSIARHTPEIAYPKDRRIYEWKAVGTPRQHLAWVGNDLIKGYTIGYPRPTEKIEK